jgi:hypothetical protein
MAGVDGVALDQLKIFTLTAPGKKELGSPEAIRKWNEGAPDRWEEFLRLLRKRYPKLEAWKVWEFQERGALHAHGLLRGAKWIHMEYLRDCAVRAGFGWRIQLEGVRKECGGLKGLLGYFTGYLLKAVEDWRSHHHVITCTRGWLLVWKRPRARHGESAWFFVSSHEVAALLRTWVPIGERWRNGGQMLGPPSEVRHGEGQRVEAVER